MFDGKKQEDHGQIYIYVRSMIFSSFCVCF